MDRPNTCRAEGENSGGGKPQSAEPKSAEKDYWLCWQI